MQLEILPDEFSVCKLAESAAPELDRPFCFYARTDAERSLVCPTARVPAGCAAREDGWRLLRVAGTLDFSLIGVIAGLAAALAAAEVGVFVVSTFDTDYLLVRQTQLRTATAALTRAGHAVRRIERSGVNS